MNSQPDIAQPRVLSPGFHFGVPHDVYLRDPCESPSLNASTMKVLLDRSPAHAWTQHPRLNPDQENDESTKFDMGSAAHGILVGGMQDRVVVVDADDWRTKAAKEERAAALALGNLPLLSRQYEDVLKMVAAARAYLAGSALAGVLDDGAGEVTVVWREQGVLSRCRLDWYAPAMNTILDYKTTAGSADPASWSRRQIELLGYDIQARWYPRGEQAARGGKEEARFVFFIQEDTPPYACSLVALSPELEALADRKIAQALTIWRECLQAGTWPAYYRGIYYAEALPWQEARVVEREADRDAARQLDARNLLAG